MADLGELVRAHETWRRTEAVNLQPSENVMSDAARALLASDFAGRYTHPGYVSPWGDRGNAYRGTRYTDEVEALAESLAREVFSAARATLRPLSGHLAGFLLLQACCRRGDRILVVHPDHGGYEGYTPGYLPEYLGLEVGYLPFDELAWNLDPTAAVDAIRDAKPRLVLLGASQILFPYDVRSLRAACDDVDAILGYDASHVLGLVAGGTFQRPMIEGVDVVSASTHKSFPGPQGGLLLANRTDVHDRALAGIMWRIEDNAHWHRIAATAQVLLEMRTFGEAYAKQVVANARSLARQLDARGFPVRFAAHGYTSSHQIAYDRSALKERWGLTPHGFADRLERNNLIVDAVGRLGTAEATRMGATAADMERIAGLIVRAAEGEDVRPEVAEVRAGLRLSFVLDAEPVAKGH
ncbi:MAG: serine hydroxymethyltransferase [Methanobacteriota archaeon]